MRVFFACTWLVACAPQTVPDHTPPEHDAIQSTNSEPPTDIDPESGPTIDDVTLDGRPADQWNEVLFSDDIVHQFELELSESALQSLATDPTTWVPGSFAWGGAVYDPVGIRLKGGGSFLPIDEKPSFKIKLDEYVDGMDLLGLELMVLNNMSSDPSMMRERLAYRVFRDAGIPAARCGHANVLVNGESYGLYAHVENIDENFLASWYEDDTGTLFEMFDVDFYDYYIDDFELEEGVDDRTSLEGAAKAYEKWGASAITAAADHVDIPHYQRFHAVSAWVGQFDAYPYSFPGDDVHLYVEPMGGLIDFIPHGTDETFGDRDRHGIDDVTGVAAIRCRDAVTCRDAVFDELWAIDGLTQDVDLLAYAEQIASQITPYAEADSRRPYDLATVQAAQDAVVDWIIHREADIASWE